MVTKAAPKSVQQKQPVKKAKAAIASKGQGSKVIPTQAYDLQEIIDLHTKHLLQLDEMFSILQQELVEIRKLIVTDKGTPVTKKPITPAKKATPAATKAPVKPVQVEKSSLPVKSGVTSSPNPSLKGKSATVKGKPTKPSPVRAAPSPTKTPAGSKKPVKSQTAAPVQMVKTPEDQAPVETQVPIPNDLADRINALTSKKKITQTQLGDEVNLTQKVIYEISERKLKVLSPVYVQKILTVLKKYESK